MKKDIFGINFDIEDYNSASDKIIENAKQNNSYAVSALAVHGLIESYNSDTLKKTVNNIDLVVPDGQPIKWALNSYYNVNLKDRVCGPDLTKEVLIKANKEKLKIYLYGSTKETLDKFIEYINIKFPNINICGYHIDRFRDATDEEDIEDINKINKTFANIVLVGRGCPRQEIWVSTHKKKINASMMAVGAAFDFFAGNIDRAPQWMQRSGLEWLYRLAQEPTRLFKRYFYTNSKFIYLFIKYKFYKK